MEASKSVPDGDRRWSAPPVTVEEARTILKRLAASGRLKAYPSYPNLYHVVSPYANQKPIEEDEILMELHPYAALSHHSALVFHQLTVQFPNEIHASIPTDGSSRISPIGLRNREWFPGLSSIRGHLASSIEGVPIHWHRLEKFNGYSEYNPNGYPVRVTTPEKTLVDGLASPEWCGGLTNVLQAWINAQDAISLQAVLMLTDLQAVGILRQRVGYVLEKLGFSHPELDAWAAKAVRGGSSRLLASAAFAPEFSERWRLSINAPTFPLEGGSE